MANLQKSKTIDTSHGMTISFEENKQESMSPMMRQYYDLKKKFPEALLLFRCGDYYETYEGDAEKAARTLGITLMKSNSIRMAGFPHHALDTYLPKLVRAGYRCAICDQLEDPKLAKKLVKRGITELVTPGNGFLDKDGVLRHSISRERLDRLCRELGRFIDDCTKEESQQYRQAFLDIKELLHQRMQG